MKSNRNHTVIPNVLIQTSNVVAAFEELSKHFSPVVVTEDMSSLAMLSKLPTNMKFEYKERHVVTIESTKRTVISPIFGDFVKLKMAISPSNHVSAPRLVLYLLIPMCEQFLKNIQRFDPLFPVAHSSLNDSFGDISEVDFNTFMYSVASVSTYEARGKLYVPYVQVTLDFNDIVPSDFSFHYILRFPHFITNIYNRNKQ